MSLWCLEVETVAGNNVIFYSVSQLHCSPFPFAATAAEHNDDGLDEERDEPESDRPVPDAEHLAHAPHRDHRVTHVETARQQRHQRVHEHLQSVGRM